MTSEKNEKPILIKINSKDNVKIVVNAEGLEAGTKIPGGFEVKEHIPQGHKIALEDLEKGDRIIKYGKTIGYAARDFTKGEWINETNVELPEMPPLEDLKFGTNIKEMPPLEGYTFSGYRNEDGSVGIKNLLGIVTSVQCVEGVLNRAMERVKNEILPEYPNVDGVVPINHCYGCGVAINTPEAEIPILTLRNIAKNPNLGETIVLSLGCEKLPPDRLFPEDHDRKVIVLQEESGYEEMEKKIITETEKALKRLNQRQRETCPASDLTIGVQCGGSDAFSGVTANPAIGYASDLLVRSGATVMFSEVSEVRDGLPNISARVINDEVGEKLKKEIAWYDDYLNLGNVDRDANPSPGNKAGGLANVVEKALGSIEKSGSGPIVDVLSPGEKVKKKGLVFAATPASDFVCGSLQLAAGINLQVFATGRGTPYGLEMAPVIKVSSRTELKEKWKDLIDVDAGTIARKEESYEEVGKKIFEKILKVASGEEESCAERWDIHNSICLFNPTRIT